MCVPAAHCKQLWSTLAASAQQNAWPPLSLRPHEIFFVVMLVDMPEFKSLYCTLPKYVGFVLFCFSVLFFFFFPVVRCILFFFFYFSGGGGEPLDFVAVVVCWVRLFFVCLFYCRAQNTFQHVAGNIMKVLT